MTHEEKIGRWISPGQFGVEIGAFKAPLPGFSPPPFYVDCFDNFGGEKVRADYYGDACTLPFRDHSLDYVATSHVLEHVANPVAAFAEWVRVLRPGGIIYLLVPDRRFTWDRPRPLTPVAHFLEDFEQGTTACDASHIDDFIYGVDWKTYSPDTPAADIHNERASRARGMHEAVARGEEINIHFHTFEPLNLLALIERLAAWPRTNFRWQLVDSAERFPANNPIGFLAVIRVDKSWSDRVAGAVNRLRTLGNPKFPLRPDARAFDEFAAKSTPHPPIPGSLDDPAEGSVVDPANLRVRGWLWNGAKQSDIAAVGAWVEGKLIGETTVFIERGDVVAALKLEAGAQPGFELSARAAAKPGTSFQLQIQARLRDGSLAFVASRPLTARI